MLRGLSVRVSWSHPDAYVKSVQERVRATVDRSFGRICQDTGIVCGKEDPCPRLKSVSRETSPLVQRFLPSMVSWSFGTEPIDDDNVRARVIGRDEQLEGFHESRSA